MPIIKALRKLRQEPVVQDYPLRHSEVKYSLYDASACYTISKISSKQTKSPNSSKQNKELNTKRQNIKNIKMKKFEEHGRVMKC